MVYRVFRRPSIDLDARPKTWEHRKPWTITVGAIVPDYGVVTDVGIADVGGSTSLRFSSGRSLYVDGSDTVYSYQ